MKIVFMGTPSFSVTILKKIIDAGHEIVLVVSQPDRRKGRGKKIRKSPVAEFALNNKLPLVQPDRVKTPEFTEIIEQCKADAAVVAAYGRILPAEVLCAPKYGCINVHASLLPKYRGAAPIQWAIRNGDESVGVSIMQLTEGMDEGPVFARKAFPMDASWNKGDLFEQMAEYGGDLLVETLERIEGGNLKPVPQNSDEATYAPMFGKNDAHIHFASSADEIVRLNRSLMPDESIYTYWQGKRLAFREASVCPSGNVAHIPGTVIVANKNKLLIACGQGALCVTIVQQEGKRAMPVADFLNGNQIAAGDYFDSSIE